MRRLTPLLTFLIALPISALASPMSGVRQLTFEGARAGEGYFSADGKRMIFQSERAESNPFYQMYLLDLETGDTERLSPGYGKTTCGWIHPDGVLDATGKWALIWRGMPGALSNERRTKLARFADLRYKASVAKARGAAGVIFAPPPRESFEDKLPRLAYEATSGVAGLPVVAVTRAASARMLSILGGDLAAMTEEIEAGKGAGRDLIGVSASGTIALDFEKRTGRNVVARLELDGLAEGGRPPLVIGAHVDHLGRGETSGSLARGEERDEIHYGADDNASGVAALIKVAQKLATDHAAGRLEDGRDVIFAAWSGEELGLLGASHFVDALAESAGVENLPDLVSAYLNMDMIGRLRDRLILSGLGSSDIWAREIERRNAVIGLPIVTSDDTYLPTDATAFYLKGVPILAAFTGAHEDYHKPSDTAETLNYKGLRDIARFMALVARSRVLAEEEPVYVAVTRPEDQGGRRMSTFSWGRSRTVPTRARRACRFRASSRTDRRNRPALPAATS